MAEKRSCIAIDLKSFYASVECIDRGLDPMNINLVVADESRTDKTICLAVSPALKTFGVPGRPRLFEVIQQVKKVNAERLKYAPGHKFTGESADIRKLKENPSLKLAFNIAVPRMRKYMDISASIYQIYLKYIAPEDIHVYSVDEVFIEATHYLKTYGLSPRELAMKMIYDVFSQTGITATAGIGTNLYLAKVAMDITAKHMEADENGVRIAELDEMSYRTLLWNHKPITDFWRVGPGYKKRLEELHLFTMGDIARCSLGKPDEYYNEDLLYNTFGVNAELLIDHAWGYEPTKISDIKAYVPEENSTSQGQVLPRPYSHEECRIIIREMADMLSLDLVYKGLVTDQIVLDITFDIINVSEDHSHQEREKKIDRYGRNNLKPAHGSSNLGKYSSSTKLITEHALKIFEKIAPSDLFIRGVYITANHIVKEGDAKPVYEQFSLFDDYDTQEKKHKQEVLSEAKEKKLQEAELKIKQRYGKNALIKGLNLQKGATAMERNRQVGGHRE